MKRTSRKGEGVTHVIGSCSICDWETQNYLEGEKLARRHCQETGHAVRVEAAHCYVVEIYTP